jgi:hypothetical protein
MTRKKHEKDYGKALEHYKALTVMPSREISGTNGSKTVMAGLLSRMFPKPVKPINSLSYQPN